MESPLLNYKGGPVWQSPTKPWALCSPDRQDMLRQAWESGNLRWKLDPNQQKIYDQIYASHGRVRTSFERQYYLDMSRQSGKDFVMSTIGLETCFRRRKTTRVVYAAPTKDTVHKLLIPTISQIFEDCPPDLLPAEIKSGTFLTNAKQLTWPWGARIELVGVDLHPDWLRGPATFLILFTEPAFVENFDGLMRGVILPQLLTMQDGFAVYGSTPPESPGHPWSTSYIPKAKGRGMYSKSVITDCPRLSTEQVEAAIDELGGRKSTRVRRELFCEHIIESAHAVVPEYQDVKDQVLTEVGFDSPPEYRDIVVGIDPGFVHSTGVVYGYVDFRTGLFMINGEINIQYANSREVARAMWAREWQLYGFKPKKPRNLTDKAWGEELDATRAMFYPDLAEAKPVKAYRDSQIKTQVYQRWSDTDSRLIADMSNEHGLMINPADKDNLEAATNALRLNIQKLKYRIHPRCAYLDAHLSQAVWNKSRTRLAENPAGGHFDLIPAFIYLNRHVPWQRNPNPPVFHDPATHFVSSGAGAQTRTGLSKLFRRQK